MAIRSNITTIITTLSFTAFGRFLFSISLSDRHISGIVRELAYQRIGFTTIRIGTLHPDAPVMGINKKE